VVLNNELKNALFMVEIQEERKYQDMLEYNKKFKKPRPRDVINIEELKKQSSIEYSMMIQDHLNRNYLNALQKQEQLMEGGLESDGNALIYF